jgi:ABC-type antimicrobial peptide transport system permease subunit
MPRWRMLLDLAISALAGVATFAATFLGIGGVAILFELSAAFDNKLWKYFPFAAVICLLLAVLYAIIATALVFKHLHRIHKLDEVAGRGKAFA